MAESKLYTSRCADLIESIQAKIGYIAGNPQAYFRSRVRSLPNIASQQYYILRSTIEFCIGDIKQGEKYGQTARTLSSRLSVIIKEEYSRPASQSLNKKEESIRI